MQYDTLGLTPSLVMSINGKKIRFLEKKNAEINFT